MQHYVLTENFYREGRVWETEEGCLKTPNLPNRPNHVQSGVNPPMLFPGTGP